MISPKTSHDSRSAQRIVAAKDSPKAAAPSHTFSRTLRSAFRALFTALAASGDGWEWQ